MLDKRSILIIVNPVSGRGRGHRTATAVAERLRACGVDVTVRQTSRQGDAERITREAIADRSQLDHCIVACGGDGTIQEVANAVASIPNSARARSGPMRCSTSLLPPLARGDDKVVSLPDSEECCGDDAGPVMGLAPAGRCNDFARALGISAKPEAVVDTLVNGKPGPVDLGKVNDRYFCTVATVGIDAEVTSFVDSMRMPLTGTLAYLYGALRVLARYQPRTLRIAGDFGTIEHPVFIASSANTSSYGGAIPIAPDAVPTDGQLDLCVIRHVSRLRAFTLVPTVLAGRHESLPETRFIRTRHLQIDADRPVELWADGELIAHTPATIEAAPGAIQVMLPGALQGTLQGLSRALGWVHVDTEGVDGTPPRGNAGRAPRSR